MVYNLKKWITAERAFQFGVILKALNGLLEALGGLVLLVIRQETLIKIAKWIVSFELSEDPKDLIANYILKTVGSLSFSTQLFVIFYLLSHGVIKIWLSISLLKRRLWAYPTAIGFFVIFVFYQSYKFVLNHSPMMFLLTIFDIAIIILTWFEYKKIRGKI